MKKNTLTGLTLLFCLVVFSHVCFIQSKRYDIYFKIQEHVTDLRDMTKEKYDYVIKATPGELKYIMECSTNIHYLWGLTENFKYIFFASYFITSCLLVFWVRYYLFKNDTLQ